MINPTDILETGYNIAKSVDLAYLADRTVDYVRNIDLGALVNNVNNNTGKDEADKLVSDVCSLGCCCTIGAVVGGVLSILAYKFLKSTAADRRTDAEVNNCYYRDDDEQDEDYKSQKPKVRKHKR
jgi:hypothetical protein